MVRRLRRKRLVRPANEGRLLLRSDQEWAVDVACDALATGRGIRILAVVDAFTRECLEAVKESNSALSFVMVQAH